MAARLPVVATAVSALPEIVIDGETGRLAPPHDPAQLAAQMSAMLGDHQRGLAAGMGQAGYARLRAEFSVSKMVRATAALYDHRRGSD
jgi:glycosyltransferase involved in cell wall biosynthesis